MRVFMFRMLAAKNSANFSSARGPARRTTAGIIDAASRQTTSSHLLTGISSPATVTSLVRNARIRRVAMTAALAVHKGCYVHLNSIPGQSENRLVR